MPWASTAISVGGSLLSGALGSSSAKKDAAKAREMARLQMGQQEAQRIETQKNLAPYIQGGSDAQNKLSYLMGTSDVEGKQYYTQNDFENAAREELTKLGVKSKRIGSMTQTYANRWYKDYLDSGKDNAKFKNTYKLRDLADKPIDTSDGQFGSLLDTFGEDDFVKEPGYNFRMMEGEQGINRAQLARGGFDSGAALKELTRFNQDYASNEYGNAYNRDAANKQRTFGYLSGQTGQGLQASGAGAANSQNAINANNQVNQNLTNSLDRASDNQNSAIQNTIGNLVYGFERYKNGNYGNSGTGGYSGSTVKDFDYNGDKYTKTYV